MDVIPTTAMDIDSMSTNSFTSYPPKHRSPDESFQNASAAFRSNKRQRQDMFDPVAVVGLSLKFPQDADSVEGFWQTLMEAKSMMTQVPPDRWHNQAFHKGSTEQFNVLGGHFVKEDIALFDASFFSVNATEAACMDPQQRALLETAYRALENAGISLQDIAGSQTSVFVGCSSREYEDLLMRDHEMEAKYIGTGSHFSMLANRLSWFFNLSGSSLALDTACSSSLLAVHLACQSLYTMSSKMAIVGGSNLIFNPDGMWPMANLNFLSPDGRCYSFDDRANGYGRGEGTAVLVLKPLKDAVRDGNTIRAVIRATGSNSDGYTPSITQPNGLAQEKLIRDTYHSAGLDLGLTRFFEAHGTGTAKGDPIEAKAISSVFSEHRSSSNPLYVGAVKTNIGHLEGASGIAGLIKTILALESGLIPPNTNFVRPNPNIDMESWNLKLPETPTIWPPGLRRASVNSFGFGGTNTHVVVDDAYHFLQQRKISGNHSTAECPELSLRRPVATTLSELADRRTMSGPRLVVFSAYDSKGVERLTTKYREYFSALYKGYRDRQDYFDNFVYTLSEKRSFLSWRAFYVVDSFDRLQHLMAQPIPSATKAANNRTVAFVFTGQGAQWRGMARELINYRIFADIVKEADSYLHSLGCVWSVSDMLLNSFETTDLNDPRVCQPLCTIIQVALVDLLRSWGLSPVGCIGHSSGEIAAAYCSNLITKDSAWKIAYYRGAISAESQALALVRGGMLAVPIGKDKWRTISQTRLKDSSVSVACYNSPQSLTLSGPRPELDELHKLFTEKGISSRLLEIPVSYHSPSMQPVAKDYLRLIGHLSAVRSTVRERNPCFSTVTNTILQESEANTAEYWVENLISPVRFSDALDSMIHSQPDIDVLVEIGPHGVLKRPIRDILDYANKSDRVEYLSALSRNVDAQESVLTLAGELYKRGFHVNFAALNISQQSDLNRCTLTDLPEYPFNHNTKYWLESRLSKEYRFRPRSVHPLLGSRDSGSTEASPMWRHYLRQSELGWISDHIINNTTIYPAGGMLVMAVEAIRELVEIPDDVMGIRLRDVEIMKAMKIPENAQGLETSLRMTKESPNNTDSAVVWYNFSLSSFENGAWSENCRGNIMAESSSKILKDSQSRTLSHAVKLKEFWSHLANCDRTTKASMMYNRWKGLGFRFGPAFQTLQSVRYDGKGSSVCTVEIDQCPAYSTRYLVHPTKLDALLQSVLPALSSGGTKRVPTFVPTAISEMWLSNDRYHMGKATAWEVSASSRSGGLRDVLSDVTACSLDGSEIYAWMQNIRATATNELDTINEKTIKMCYSIRWLPDLDSLNDNHSISRYCSSMDKSLSDKSGAMLNVELASFVYLSRLLQSIEGQSVNFPKPHFARYIHWARKQLQRLEGDSNLRARLVQSQILDSPEKQRELLSKLPHGSPFERLCFRVGENLKQLVTGQMEAISLLFQDSLLDDFYLWSISGRSRSERLITYLDVAAHKNPNMQILEIGAGTGSGTVSAMKVLSSADTGVSRFKSYTFTDISPSFFVKAQEKLSKDIDKILFKTLDISKDPIQQDFLPDSFDMILAVNVLHATSDISTTLRNIRRILKKGGKLVLVENCNVFAIHTGFIFGVLPDWWLSTGGSRKWGALLSETDWTCALAQNGFSGAELCFRDTDEPHEHISNIIVATAVELEQNWDTPSAVPTKDSIAIVADPESNFQQELGTSLCHSIQDILNMRSRVLPLGAALQENLMIYLLELDQPIFPGLTTNLLETLRACYKPNQRVLWITRSPNAEGNSPEYNMVTGWARCIRTEIPSIKLVTLAFENPRSNVDILSNIIHTLKNLAFGNLSRLEEEYIEKDGLFYTPRIMPNSTMDHNLQPSGTYPVQQIWLVSQLTSRSLKLRMKATGRPDLLHFVDNSDMRAPLKQDEAEIEIVAAGLSAQDLGILHGKHAHYQDRIGLEGAGIVKRLHPNYTGDLRIGDRVAGFFEGSVRTSTRTKTSLIAVIPIDLDLTTAAGIPVAYCTAFHALQNIAKFSDGMSILLHYDAGGIGDAIIQLTSSRTNQTFVTFEHEEERHELISRYNIPEQNLLSSQDPFLDESVMSLTHGKGVDVCISQYSGEIARRSLNCISEFGCFIDINHSDVRSVTVCAPEIAARCITASFVDIFLMIQKTPRELGSTLRNVLHLFDTGMVHAKIGAVFGFSELEAAFQHATSKPILELRQDESIQVVPEMTPPYELQASATYIIAGLGGLGRSISRWLVRRGARNLILLSRSGVTTTKNRKLVEELCSQGVRIQAPKCDVSDLENLSQVINDALVEMPPIRGCIQGAMVLRDAMFENMTLEQFEAAIRPKVNGSWNLHQILPKELDFFILLSSLNGNIPFKGQCNYAAGNTFQDALAEHRVTRNQKAVAIDLGIMSDVGYVAEHEGKVAAAAQAYDTVSEATLHSLLEYYCNPALPVVSPKECQILVGITPASLIRQRTGEDPHWKSRSLCRVLNNVQADIEIESVTSPNNNCHNNDNTTNTNHSTAISKPTAVRELLRNSSSEAVSSSTKRDIIASSLIEKLARTLAVSIEELDGYRSMNSYGTDSLVAVEIKNWVQSELGVEIAVFEILDNTPINGFSDMLLERWSAVSNATANPQQSQVTVLE